jgi:hypothetical protein
MNDLNAQEVTSTEEACVTDRFLPGDRLFKRFRLGWQWRHLKWDVADAAEAAQGHEANGARPGSQEFKTIYNEVEKKVQEYSHDSGIPVEPLKAKLPALCAIERLAHPDASVPQNRFGLTLGIFIAAILGSIGLGVLIGLGTGIAHWIAHLFA